MKRTTHERFYSGALGVFAVVGFQKSKALRVSALGCRRVL